MAISYTGGCFCGSVRYKVTGTPILSAYCHCTLCQRLNACPFIHTAHFPASAFSWVQSEPADTVADCYKVPSKPWKRRWRCKTCGSNVSSENSKTERWSIWGATLDRDSNGRIIGWDALKPTSHMFYGTRMVDVADDLGKWEGYENQSQRLD